MISITNQLEFRHLRYFLVLAEELHYRRASEQLYISQSALSQQIKQLEEILDIKLFNRTNKKVELSEAGRIFQQEARQVLKRLESSVQQLNLFKKGNTGQILIGFVASAMESILPKILKRFNEIYPNIEFQLDELSNKEQLKAIEQGELDIAFIRSNQISEEMAIQRVYMENFVLVLPKNHPMSKAKFQHIGQLKDDAFILFPNDKSQLYYQQILSLCADRGFSPKIAHRSIHAPTIFKLVANNMGISILPTSLADHNNPLLKYIEIDNVPQHTELFVAWRKDNENTALPYFLEMLDRK